MHVRLFLNILYDWEKFDLNARLKAMYNFLMLQTKRLE